MVSVTTERQTASASVGGVELRAETVIVQLDGQGRGVERINAFYRRAAEAWLRRCAEIAAADAGAWTVCCPVLLLCRDSGDTVDDSGGQLALPAGQNSGGGGSDSSLDAAPRAVAPQSIGGCRKKETLYFGKIAENQKITANVLHCLSKYGTIISIFENRIKLAHFHHFA